MLHMAMPIEHLDITVQATQFGLAGHSGMAWAAGLAAAACGAVVYRGLWRVSVCRLAARLCTWCAICFGMTITSCSFVQVKRLDNFEQQIKM